MKASIVVGSIAVALTMVMLGKGCASGGSEGDRCNPKLSHDECNVGLSCRQPATCVESYCCPDPGKSSANPFCNGTACPPGDGGADAAPLVPPPVGSGG
jgi:hypothetical protein